MKFPAFEPINLKNVPQSFEAVDLYLSQIEPDKNQSRKNWGNHIPKRKRYTIVTLVKL